MKIINIIFFFFLNPIFKKEFSDRINKKKDNMK